jgi:aminoglycoside/choline kinase family phosphotransferase
LCKRKQVYKSETVWLPTFGGAGGGQMDIKNLKNLFQKKFNKDCIEVSLLVPAGSARQYYRLRNEESTAIGAYNRDVRENRAFFSFTKDFLSKSLPVPEVYEVSEDEQYYLLEDLGNTSLKDLTDLMRKGWDFPPEMIPWYYKVIDALIRFQTEGYHGLDFSICIPRDAFDSRSILWDLNHFKYFFLKLSGIPFDEEKLENDFQQLSQKLDQVERNSFLFRDFQSRNIMIKDENLYFIDYQGGRKGALQYDIATLLFEARVNMSTEIRKELLEYYLEKISRVRENFIRADFLSTYHLFALLRQLQAMGAYGLRGWVEKKPLFLQSIPFAMQNLKYFLEADSNSISQYPELYRLMEIMIKDEKLNCPIPAPADKLCIRISSFSYQKAIPDDPTGEGGGFVFDCRGIHNPGRYPEFKNLTGKDAEVQKFFEEKTDIGDFLHDVFSLTDRTVKTYIGRGFKNLQISFGCTGGQHRSVYAAEKLAEHLEHNRSVTVFVEHRELKDLKPDQ